VTIFPCKSAESSALFRNPANPFARRWPLSFRRLAGALALFLAGWFSPFGPALAQEAADGAESGKTPPVQITARNLVADDGQKTATFSGEVRAVQGDTVILSDRLIIRYAGNPMAGGEGAAENGGGIRELEAEGNVRITFDEIVAESPKAVYTPADRVLVLSGPGSRVTRPESGTISGKTITVFRDDGRIRFEGGVEGLFFPGDAGLE
jgi:lipopolysaccharide export system protein LptA